MTRTVIGIDSSTQSTKVVAFDAAGNALAEGRASHDIASPAPGHHEQDPDWWWDALRTALGELWQSVDAGSVDAIAISNQRETVAFLDASGAALRPAMLWLDERAFTTYEAFAERLGHEFLHRTTGKPIDVIPVANRLDWMRQNEPETLDATATIADVQAYLTGRLTGRRCASWSSADPFGILDIQAMDWSIPILEAVGVRRDQLPELVRPGSLVGRVTKEAAERLGLKTDTPVFAAGGDGQCAGLGTNAFEAGTIYLNLGTATITGVYSPTPAINRNWRTMTGPTGEGYFLESIQKTGAFFVNWVVDTFCGGRDDPHVFERLEAEAAKLPVGADGVTMTPHLAGVMNPHWDPAARVAIVGLSANHGKAHLYRAAIEAITVEIARGIAAMRGEGLTLERIRAIGGGANSPLWMQMIADATGLPVERSTTVEASALGAAIIAATGEGWFGSFDAAAHAMTRVAGIVMPQPSERAEWDRFSHRQAGLYGATKAYGRDW
ncbi:FGGY-family carbohydrate kinase [Jiella sp. MQZ9-1]|uniref:FGGY-family carbohydrate kinase n=1 Tax=Jiella flava TaxID=2816857 RepID=A0A939FZ73_9HYPH|nr:FGGY-family carbohydrate kinase [Jiella flava]MBO0662920.1 FGGY-family carbohydrate kinase [Jiella flava]MCD2471320.1 FGGY-family carbohydrate kinase [Jiella flava]